MNLENDLRRVLRRESPPAGFAGRVLERIEREPARKPRAWWHAAAASVTLAAVLGGYGAYRVAEHRRGEFAKEQVLTAMRIAGEKVKYAQEEVRAIGSHD